MRAVGLHRDVIVVTSRIWQTNCVVVRGGDEALVIDSPVYPDELEMLPALLEQAGFPFSGLLVTHGDWDHLLGRLAFPGAAIGCAETTAARLTAEPGAAQRALRDFDASHYLRRPAPLSLGQVQALPVPGHCAAGSRELELHPADGHTADGMAIWAPWAGVLVCGDYLSPVELPMLSVGGSLDAYRATLSRLEALVEVAQCIVPGHGPVLDRDAARRLLEEDGRYLQGLAEQGEAVALPAGRRDSRQREIHRENLGSL